MRTSLARILLLSLLVAALEPAQSLAAGVPPFIGPIRIRDLSPISMLRLDFVPAHACTGDASLRVLRVDYSEANVFIVSDTVSEYLEERGSSRRFTDEDLARLASSSGDYFIFDAELVFADFEYIRALSARTQMRVEWPLLARGGGFLDSTIETFHSATGLNSAQRDLLARNDVNIVARIGGATVTEVGPRTRTALGDPTLSLSQSFPMGPDADLTIEGAAKIALGGERSFFSSGATDWGVQVAAEKRFKRNAFYADANFVRVGNGRVFQEFRLTNSPTALLAWERKAGPRTWTVVQTTWSRETLKPRTNTPLDEDRIQISGGLRRSVGRNAVATFAITENVVHFKNTPDLGVHLSLAWIMGH